MTQVSNRTLPTLYTGDVHDLNKGVGSDDATWILTSAFIIFTMQSGFGLLESGMVSKKNEVNIMVKNAVDVVYGGLAYWLFGFALSFGEENTSNSFCSFEYFLTDADEDRMGWLFAKYFFQLSFATTATTIVSGAMAERTSLKAYILFSFANTLTYCFPAHWVWGSNGWLKNMGAIDIAGCSAVHIVGGTSGLIATLVLKPRFGKFEKGNSIQQMASPTNAMLGTFMLWWGWLGFNCGSTFGISGSKWKLASRSAVITINGSIGGAVFSMFYSYVFCNNKLVISVFLTGILSGLVSITGICAVCRPWEGFIIGVIGAAISCLGVRLLDKLKIDDPVSCVPTHMFAGIWGLIAVALFVEVDSLEGFSSEKGILKGGKLKLLGVQFAMIGAVIIWAATITFLELYLIDKFIGLRMTLQDEIIGADAAEHGIYDTSATQDGFQIVNAHGSQRVFGRTAYKDSFQRQGEDRAYNIEESSCQFDNNISYDNRKQTAAKRFRTLSSRIKLKKEKLSIGTSHSIKIHEIRQNKKRQLAQRKNIRNYKNGGLEIDGEDVKPYGQTGKIDNVEMNGTTPGRSSTGHVPNSEHCFTVDTSVEVEKLELGIMDRYNRNDICNERHIEIEIDQNRADRQNVETKCFSYHSNSNFKQEHEPKRSLRRHFSIQHYEYPGAFPEVKETENNRNNAWEDNGESVNRVADHIEMTEKEGRLESSESSYYKMNGDTANFNSNIPEKFTPLIQCSNNLSNLGHDESALGISCDISLNRYEVTRL